jgi:PBSX family phage portal protein
MADRSSRIVDDVVELPEIDHVVTLVKRVIEEGPIDPFARPAEELKHFAGNTPVMKRKITNEIKKFQRGVDGAESKQIIDKDYLTGYDTYGLVEPQNNFESFARLYERSPAHMSAVNAKVANIVGLGYRFIENSKTKRDLEKLSKNEDKQQKKRQALDEEREDLIKLFDKFNEEDTFLETLIKVWRDYETMGNAFIEVGRKRDGTVGYVGHIPAQTMRRRRKRDGWVQVSGFQVQFFAPFGAGVDDKGMPQRIANPIGGGQPNEVINLLKYTPTSSYYGVPDIISAMDAVAGNKFAAQYNLDYFENKAVPRYAIILKGATLGANAETALLSFFETGLKGQNHRSIYIPLPGDTPENKVELNLEAIEAGVQEASFDKYRKSNLSDILMAHRVPITKIDISTSASLAIAKDADKTFKEQVCAPEQKILEKKLDRLVRELTESFELKLNEMSLTDEDTQSKIDERNVKNGIDLPNEARTRRGMPGIPGGNERVDLMAAAKIKDAAQQAKDSATPRARDSQRSASATDSAGRARNPKGEGRSSP